MNSSAVNDGNAWLASNARACKHNQTDCNLSFLPSASFFIEVQSVMKAGIKQRQIHWFCCSVRNLLLSSNKSNNGSRGGRPGNSLWECAAQFSKSWPYFRPTNVIFHTRFQTRPLKSIPVFSPIMLAKYYLLDLVKRSVKFSINSLAISEFISIITKTSKCSLVVISLLVNTRNMLWLLVPIKNEIFRPTKSFTSLKKARKKGHLDLWHPLRPSSPPKPWRGKKLLERRNYMYYVKQMKPESSTDSQHNRYALG